jgi:hypothetical protein
MRTALSCFGYHIDYQHKEKLFDSTEKEKLPYKEDRNHLENSSDTNKSIKELDKEKSSLAVSLTEDDSQNKENLTDSTEKEEISYKEQHNSPENSLNVNKHRKKLDHKNLQLGVLLTADFLFLSLFSWSLIGQWNSSHYLEKSKGYIAIGLISTFFIMLCCLIMLRMKNHHIVSMLGLSFAFVGCIAFSLTITNTAIYGFHLSCERSSCFTAVTILLAYVSTAKSKRSKMVGCVAFLMQMIGAFTLLNEALDGSTLHLNISDTGTKIMLGVAILGVGLMIVNAPILLNRKDEKVHQDIVKQTTDEVNSSCSIVSG